MLTALSFRRTGAAALTVFWMLSSGPGIVAQWLNYPTRGMPRTGDGAPLLTAPSPRKPNGEPDLSGIWMVPGLKYLINIAADLREVPFQPWAEAVYRERLATQGKDDPNNFCLPSVIPEKIAVTSPWKIVETPGLTLILYESRTIFRQVFTDGRSLPGDPNPTWQGYSIGRWDADTFLVETSGFNGKGWLDTNGHPTTDALRVIERYHRADWGHLDVDITIDDRKAYTGPWTVHERAELIPDTELLEYICEENNKDPQHILDATRPH